MAGSGTDLTGLGGRKYTKADWLGAPIGVRLHYMLNDLMVPYPQFTRVVTEIERRVDRCTYTKTGDGMFIVASTGSGKTFLIRYFRARWTPHEEAEYSYRPVLAFNVPPSPATTTMGSAFLTAAEDPEPYTGNSLLKLDRCIKLANGCRTRVIFLDNAHRIPEKRRRVGVRGIGDWVCDINDATQALFVVMGASPVEEVRKANEQTRRRTFAQFNIDYFSLKSRTLVATFLRFLHALDLRLPLARYCGIAKREIAIRIYCATFGIIDTIIDLMVEVITVAVAKGLESFGVEELAIAYVRMVGDANATPNPFGPDFKIRSLTGPGELFEDWLVAATKTAPSKSTGTDKH
jgi:Bacterial TniB protein